MVSEVVCEPIQKQCLTCIEMLSPSSLPSGLILESLRFLVASRGLSGTFVDLAERGVGVSHFASIEIVSAPLSLNIFQHQHGVRRNAYHGLIDTKATARVVMNKILEHR